MEKRKIIITFKTPTFKLKDYNILKLKMKFKEKNEKYNYLCVTVPKANMLNC